MRRFLAALVVIGSLVAFNAPVVAKRKPIAAVSAVSVAPTTPPAQVCGNAAILDGPATAPTGAVTVPAGNNSGFFDTEKFAGATGKTYWFAPGTHTLNDSEFASITALTSSTYVGAPGAILDGRLLNRYAFTGSGTDVTVKHLTVKNFVAPGTEGTINGSSSPRWTITNNTITNNSGSGVFTGDNVLIRDNCITSNGAHGVSGYRKALAAGYGPSAINNVTVTKNEISYHPRDTHFERNPDGSSTGCGCTGGAKFWDTKGAVVSDNYVHHNSSPALWADTNNVDFLIEGNYLSDNGGEAIWYEISYNATIRNNTFLRNTWEKGARRAGQNFPDGPIYIAESGGESRVSPNRTTLEISGNYLEDNWGSVALWEAAERFCASPANTSAGYCTKVNPNVNHTVCSDMTAIKNEPYYSDCRWMTKNVLVTNNTFKINNANLPASCTGSPNCGNAALFSGFGVDYPTGTPYKGYVVADRITYASNNVFSNNTYIGDWEWTAHNAGNKLTFAQWQAAPYSQDAGSTFNGASATTTTTQATTTTTSTSSTTTTTAPTTTTTTTAPAPAVGNHLDADTSTFTNSLGKWIPWYSSTVERHQCLGEYGMKVTATGSNWGVTVKNWPGFAATPGTKTISFEMESSTPRAVSFLVRWKNASGSDISTDRLWSPGIAGWHTVSTTAIAPQGTAYVYLELSGQSTAGDWFMFDDFYVGG